MILFDIREERDSSLENAKERRACHLFEI